MKRTVFVLSMIFCFGVGAYDGTISKSGSCGATVEDCHYDLYDDGHLEISGSGKMTNWNKNSPWKNITSVHIEGITSIGSYAFFGCINLTDVYISDSVKEIRHGAFEATTLTNIKIPHSVEKFFDCAFCDTQLTILTIPENATLVSYIFGNPYTTYQNADIPTTIFCEEKIIKQCQEAVQWRKDKGQEVEVAVYKKTDNGKVFYKNRWYSTANDISSGNYIPKRIYTIDEANRIAGEKNRVSIKYR